MHTIRKYEYAKRVAFARYYAKRLWTVWGPISASVEVSCTSSIKYTRYQFSFVHLVYG